MYQEFGDGSSPQRRQPSKESYKCEERYKQDRYCNIPNCPHAEVMWLCITKKESVIVMLDQKYKAVPSHKWKLMFMYRIICRR